MKGLKTKLSQQIQEQQLITQFTRTDTSSLSDLVPNSQPLSDSYIFCDGIGVCISSGWMSRAKSFVGIKMTGHMSHFNCIQVHQMNDRRWTGIQSSTITLNEKAGLNMCVTLAPYGLRS